MIEDEELRDLPDDPELAFVQYERKLRQWMRQFSHSREDWEIERDYVNHVLAFLAAHDLRLFDPEPDPPLNDLDFSNFFRDLLRKIDYWTIQFRVRHNERLRQGIKTIVHIPPDLKREIHQYINLIRQLIDKIDLPIKKREAIFIKLNALADEVDRDRTRADALMSLALEVADTGGEVAERLAPVRRLTDSLSKLFAKAKELTEQLGLPPRHEPKKIEGPRKGLPSPQEDDLDDEIPF